MPKSFKASWSPLNVLRKNFMGCLCSSMHLCSEMIAGSGKTEWQIPPQHIVYESYTGRLQCPNKRNELPLSSKVELWVLHFCCDVTTVVLVKGEGSCSPFFGWSSGVSQGTVNVWHFQKLCQRALLFMAAANTLRRVPTKTLFSQGLGRFSY